MARVTAALVKELRERTAAGMMNCKKALVETDGNLEEAALWLREKGIAGAAKKSGRIASEGVVHSYIHAGGKIGVLVEVNCETDFAARGEAFQALVKDIAMHIAATGPAAVKREDLDPSIIDEERKVFRAQAQDQGKPEKIVDKIVEGRIDKFYREICLLEQPFVKDTEKTVDDVVKEAIATIGENISVRRFTRYELGEGLEKRTEDFAEEVARVAAKN